MFAVSKRESLEIFKFSINRAAFIENGFDIPLVQEDCYV